MSEKMNDLSNLVREFCAENNICTKCHRRATRSKNYQCDHCLEKKRVLKRKYRKMLKEKGIKEKRNKQKNRINVKKSKIKKKANLVSYSAEVERLMNEAKNR
jgi:hypothetical protein